MIFAKILHMFPAYQCLQKRVRDFFFFCLNLELFTKIKERPSFYKHTETGFTNNSRSKQNEKNSEHPFVDIGK